MLRPADIAVLLSLRLHPLDSYAAMAERLGISKSSAHGGVRRLIRNRLAHPSKRSMAVVADGPAVDFLSYGVPYAFAPDVIPRARGVPTGLKALSQEGMAHTNATAMVWPSKLGNTEGLGVNPLVPAAPDIRHRDPDLYAFLALLDALRLGDARERDLARKMIRERFAQLSS